MNKSKIKICGIKDINILKCCIKNKVDFFGLVFYKKSVRNIEINDAKKITNFARSQPISSVGVFVDKPICEIKTILKEIKLDFIQLHGSENEDYIYQIKKDFDVKVIKTFHIDNKSDLINSNKLVNVDMFLFDYKPKYNELPGGNAKKFSWKILSNVNLNKPWFLSGGININNIDEIKNYANPYGIDISSGVEEKHGNKSEKKICSLLKKYDH